MTTYLFKDERGEYSANHLTLAEVKMGGMSTGTFQAIKKALCSQYETEESNMRVYVVEDKKELIELNCLESGK